MSGIYRETFDVGPIKIHISVVDENDGAHVQIWSESWVTIDGQCSPAWYPPGLLDAINAWCATSQAQDWALAREASQGAKE